MYKTMPLMVDSTDGYNVKSEQKFENLSLEPRPKDAVSTHSTTQVRVSGMHSKPLSTFPMMMMNAVA
jgi:hypothetical protein